MWNIKAKVTAISQESWQLLGKPQLNMSSEQLFGPSRHPLQVLGQYKLHISHKGRLSTQQVFVAKGLKNNLLGLPAIAALNLVAWRRRFPVVISQHPQTIFGRNSRKVFQGLGKLGEEGEIKLTWHKTILSVHPSTRPTATLFQGHWRTEQNGGNGCDLQSHWTYSMVCWDGTVAIDSSISSNTYPR